MVNRLFSRVNAVSRFVRSLVGPSRIANSSRKVIFWIANLLSTRSDVVVALHLHSDKISLYSDLPGLVRKEASSPLLHSLGRRVQA